MNVDSLVFPILVILAVVLVAGYFLGRRKNLLLMKRYADVLENALRPDDQQYTWLGGYIGFKAEYKGKWGVVNKVRPTLHLKPRLSLLYYPIALLTMRHDKLYIVAETSQAIKGEAHLIQKGYYRMIGPNIENVDKFQRRNVILGGRDFELFFREWKEGERLLGWAQGLMIDLNRVKHLSFTSSTNVLYAFIEPRDDLITTLLRKMPDLAWAVVA